MIGKSKNFSEVKPAATVRKHGEAVGTNHRRKHVRVDDVLKVDYKKISQQDYKRCKGKSEVIFKNTFGKPFEAPKIEEANLELLYKLIYQANQKIDRILNMLESKDTEKYESVGSDCVNISGSGIKFIANQSFSIGDIIALRLFLPLVSMTWVNILGEVVSSTKSGSENRSEVTVKFKELAESDREIIIGHVFKRQRELLRLTSDIKNREPLNLEL
ncbi:MAG: hypothetical protein SRB1_00664 [Desulfobacteraceae bacterium Eth-SRB1]|nr:MAG: hypothetical protein SRB1_00664 [Desulfobacteraceae bacterium Eth-SRB1]